MQYSFLVASLHGNWIFDIYRPHCLVARGQNLPRRHVALLLLFGNQETMLVAKNGRNDHFRYVIL
jgi:hypothetical protein